VRSKKLDTRNKDAPLLALSRDAQREVGAAIIPEKVKRSRATIHLLGDEPRQVGAGMPISRRDRSDHPIALVLNTRRDASIDNSHAEKRSASASERHAAASALQRFTQHHSWHEPDIGVLHLHRRSPPKLFLEVFGAKWRQWITMTSEAAACPPDYVVAPLLASASVLIGHARWAQATPGWREPPHLWLGVVGDSGDGKSPGADCLIKEVLPNIERAMLADFPERLREWRAATAFERAAIKRWGEDVLDAHRNGGRAPLPPVKTAGPEPQAPRLRLNDVTIEKVASLLAAAAPKGLLIIRDELSGWFAGMNAYNDGGRAFWIEAYGGRPYRVERVKHPEPIIIPRLAVAVCGGAQPEKLARLMRTADDGLLGRMLWVWPEPVRFRLARQAPGAAWAAGALDRLRELDLQPGNPPAPIMVLLADAARVLMERFGGAMQDRQALAGGLLRSAIAKARGQALRLALVLEMLWWCGDDGIAAPPSQISVRAFSAAARLIESFFLPMAERVYGDAVATEAERNAATLARWIMGARPVEFDIRHVQTQLRLPGLRTAKQIRAAADLLVEADWLRAPVPETDTGQHRPAPYAVNPRLWEAAQ
jgi:hypothetical protein